MFFMATEAPNLNYFWSELIVEELIRCGVRYFCIAPGSRSAPLISAAARNRGAQTFVHADERGLAFHALGYVSGSGQAAAVITTSGTAAANLLPAVIEASKKKLPLILITADRPPELQKTGAMQTIEQEGLFGAFVRWTFTLPCPSSDIPPAFVLTTIDQAVARARGEVNGPVHLNCQFRDPLSPESRPFPRALLSALSPWTRSRDPWTRYALPGNTPTEAAVQLAVQRTEAMHNGIIVVGKLKDSSDAEAVMTFAERTGFPVFPDMTSNLRLGDEHPNVIPYFDQILLSGSCVSALKIDGIIHFGGRMTSRRFYELTAELDGVEYISILGHPLRSDPLHRVTLRVQSDVGKFVRTAMAQLAPRQASPGLLALRRANQAVGRVIERALSGKTMNEMAIARTISQIIPEGNGLFLSNSMPVRDMDMYADPAGARIAVGGNRGASGIDGIVASAAGFALGLGRPVTLVVGDTALLHDLNSLAMLSRSKVPLTVVVVNNDGGGIFSFLPITADGEVFERCIAAPHGLTFRKAAELFGIGYSAPTDMAAFTRQYRAAVKTGKCVLVECRTRRKANLKAHQALQRKIMEKLSQMSIKV
jgi:2-succinyl-5-enolpyruvyl-6-hydroxy-3-cyclohexene-1-carboxylate synthase